jgi:hypothetical protein
VVAPRDRHYTPKHKEVKKKQIAAVAIVGKCVVLMVAGIQGCVVAVLWQ